MLKKAEKGENLTGNDQYEGFCKDLADLIAKNMNIKCMNFSASSVHKNTKYMISTFFTLMRTVDGNKHCVFLCIFRQTYVGKG